MYKFLGAVICVCLFSGASCAPQSLSNTPSPTTQAEPEKESIPAGFVPFVFEEFSTVIPKSWTLDESQKSTNRAVFMFEKTTDSSLTPRSISFTVFPVAAPAPTLGDLLVQAQEELTKSGAQQLTTDIVTTVNLSYLRLDFTITHQGITYATSQYTSVGAEHILLITETTPVISSRGTSPTPEILSHLSVQ